MALGEAVVAGRDAEADVALGDRQVSRRHLRIIPEGPGHVAEDLESTHGTFVNGTRITRRVLKDGDQIQLGNVLVVYRVGSLEEAQIVDSITAMGVAAPKHADSAAPRLGVLIEASRAIAEADGTADSLARVLLGSLCTGLAAERGLIGLLERGGGVRRVLHGLAAEEIVIPPGVQKACVERKESLLCEVGKSSAIAAPLLAAGKPLGFAFVLRRSSPFSASDRDFLIAFGHLAGSALAQAGERGRLTRVVESMSEPAVELVGEDESMRALRERIDRFAQAPDTAVLIRGESGSGKEVCARLVHARSPRASQPFVAVNCAAIPDTLIESELFGHEKGAFTGAVRSKRGKFTLADGGTLFLDEIGDLSASAQAKVLRAIEEGEILPLGSEETEHVDVRILSATHKPLEAEIAAGRFRSDLFYRLSVLELLVPPLRLRGGDVVVLAENFLARSARRLGKSTRGFSDSALATLRAYSWPGNVRQLANEVERALLLSDGEEVDLDDLRTRIIDDDDKTMDQPTTFRDAERALVEKALKDADGNIQATARALGISRNTLYRKLNKYKLVPE